MLSITSGWMLSPSKREPGSVTSTVRPQPSSCRVLDQFVMAPRAAFYLHGARLWICQPPCAPRAQGAMLFDLGELAEGREATDVFEI